MKNQARTMGYVAHNGGRLFFQAAGTGEALVFIHGFALDRRLWSRQIDGFQNGHRVVAYDCRGFGRSSVPTGSYSHAEDLGILLDRLEISRACLIGLSMGGRIALNFAISRPKRVSSLVLIGSDVGGHRFTFDWDPEGVTLEAMRAAWLSHAVFDGVRNDPAMLGEVKVMVADYTGFHWREEDPREPDHESVVRLHQVAARTSVVVGEHDLPDFQVIAQLLARRIPEAALTRVPEVGHLLPIESPAACAEIIRRHLSGSRSDGRASESGSR